MEERDFFKEPFSEAEIRELASGIGVSQLFARRSPSLKQMGMADRELSEEKMVELMLKEPRLVPGSGSPVVPSPLKSVKKISAGLPET